MASTWALEEDFSFHINKASAGDDDEALKTWIMQDQLVQDGYLNCMFEHQPPKLSFQKGAPSLPAMASSTLLVPPSPSDPPLNFCQFSRPAADAKALLQMAGIGQRMKFNDLHVNPNQVAPAEVSMSVLSSTDSNVGLAHQHDPQISLPITKEIPCLPQGLGAAAAHNSFSANSANCLEKTHNESAVHPLTAILPSTGKEVPCLHKGFKDADAPLNSSSTNSVHHSEKTHNESAMHPLTVISMSVGKEPCRHQGLASVVALNSSSANSANCSEKTRKESHVHPSIEEIDPQAEAEKCSLRRNTGSLKRARVPELHNKSEKRRRDKINEKMRALQQLIPNSGKTDKSSILDEAIEYLKYLQLQIQYMWMQSGMDPRPLMLLTGMQAPKAYHQPPYLQQMGMSTGLMGMDMAMGYGTSIGHPLRYMATMQSMPGQRIPSSQQHPNSSFINASNIGYDGIQSSVVNGTHFPQTEHQQ